jgi:hypothetical protein
MVKSSTQTFTSFTITFVILNCQYYYAKALNQYYDSLERLSRYKDGGLVAEMRAVTIKALEKF